MSRELLLLLCASTLCALDPRVEPGYRQIRTDPLCADLTFAYLSGWRFGDDAR